MRLGDGRGACLPRRRLISPWPPVRRATDPRRADPGRDRRRLRLPVARLRARRLERPAVRVDRRRRRVRDVPDGRWRRAARFATDARAGVGPPVRRGSPRGHRLRRPHAAHGLPAGHPVRLRRLERLPRHGRARSAPVGDARDRPGRSRCWRPVSWPGRSSRPSGRPPRTDGPWWLVIARRRS